MRDFFFPVFHLMSIWNSNYLQNFNMNSWRTCPIALKWAYNFQLRWYPYLLSWTIFFQWIKKIYNDLLNLRRQHIILYVDNYTHKNNSNISEKACHLQVALIFKRLDSKEWDWSKMIDLPNNFWISQIFLTYFCYKYSFYCL